MRPGKVAFGINTIKLAEPEGLEIVTADRDKNDSNI